MRSTFEQLAPSATPCRRGSPRQLALPGAPVQCLSPGRSTPAGSWTDVPGRRIRSVVAGAPCSAPANLIGWSLTLSLCHDEALAEFVLTQRLGATQKHRNWPPQDANTSVRPAASSSTQPCTPSTSSQTVKQRCPRRYLCRCTRPAQESPIPLRFPRQPGSGWKALTPGSVHAHASPSGPNGPPAAPLEGHPR